MQRKKIMQSKAFVLVKIKKEPDGHDCWGKTEYTIFYYIYDGQGEFIGKFTSPPSCDYREI